MKEYTREYPLFSLCGLNCGLCPRFHTEGESRCPGCGGKDFHLKHPSCAVINCNQKHDQVEYCYQCSSFPCKKYSCPSEVDSFITYRNVLSDFNKAMEQGLEQYKKELNEKMEILEYLLNHYNDGRRKNFYCIAVNLLTLHDLKDIMNKIDETISKQDFSLKDKIKTILSLFEDKAKEQNIDLKLRR